MCVCFQFINTAAQANHCPQFSESFQSEWPWQNKFSSKTIWAQAIRILASEGLETIWSNLNKETDFEQGLIQGLVKYPVWIRNGKD